MKVCSKCGIEKSRSEFHKSKKESCGLQSRCKQCRSEDSKIRNGNPRRAVKNGYKWCPECEIEKKKSEFSKRGAYCKPCASFRTRAHTAGLSGEQKIKTARRKRLKRYGLTEDAFNKMWQGQKGQCAICSVNLNLLTRTHIDHCHNTGKIRGILCPSCNTSLGGFKDSPAMLQRAIEYITQEQ